MRRFPLFLLLLTSAAAPVFAAGEEDGRQHRQSAEASDNRAQRGGARGPSEEQDARAATSQRAERGPSAQQGSLERMREHYRQQREERARSLQMPTAGNEPVRRLRPPDGVGGDSGSGLRPRDRHVRTIPDTQPSTTTQSSGGLGRAFEGRQRRDYRDGNYTRWSGSRWRNDHRYDWRGHRDRHRSLFHLGFYYDPFGWNYRRWSVGSYLYPSYYGSRFWLNDPWQYRLPPAYGPYRWVRYWDDALLVNTYTGTVVDVIHNFFW